MTYNTWRLNPRLSRNRVSLGCKGLLYRKCELFLWATSFFFLHFPEFHTLMSDPQSTSAHFCCLLSSRFLQITNFHKMLLSNKNCLRVSGLFGLTIRQWRAILLVRRLGTREMTSEAEFSNPKFRSNRQKRTTSVMRPSRIIFKHFVPEISWPFEFQPKFLGFSWKRLMIWHPAF